MIMIMIIVVVIIQILEKMGKCPFQKKKKNPAFCPIFQANYGNALILKLDFLKIELLKKKKSGDL